MLLTVELSHDDLAEMIASSRPMVSRLIADMMDQRVIARQGKHYILLNNTAASATNDAPVRATNNAPVRATAQPRMVASLSLANGARG